MPTKWLKLQLFAISREVMSYLWKKNAYIRIKSESYRKEKENKDTHLLEEKDRKL